jgi:polysaccharide pyruvyl transferase WcaK-like protein
MALLWTRDIRALWSRADLCTTVTNPTQEMASSQVSADSSRLLCHSIRSVALLSPTSGNLGNAAMQRAMIANLRKRIGPVEIYGITLNPEETRRRLGIEAFPLAAASLAYYTPVGLPNSLPSNPKTTRLGQTRTLLRRIPLLPGIVRRVKRLVSLASFGPRQLATRVSRFFRTVILELAHIRESARVVRKLDCIVIPGGGTLDDFWGGPWGQPWALFKWSVLSRLLGVPFLFVSIGKCSLDSPLSRFFASIALRFATYRSYRDPDSRDAVQTLIGVRNDKVYPDLAFSYPGPELRRLRGSGPQSTRLVVGVSPIAYCDPRVWPRKDQQRYETYVSRLAEVVRWLIKEGHRVFFFTTDGPDTQTVVDVLTALRSGGVDADAIQVLPGSTEQSPEGLLNSLDSSDLIIASRLHGVILSHLNGLPVLAISFDPKVDAHMNATGQQDYCLNIDSLQFEMLIERFNALCAFRRKEVAHIRFVAQAFRQKLDEQYDYLFGAARASLVKE